MAPNPPMNPNEALRLAQQALARAQEQKKQNEEFMRQIGPAIIGALKPMFEQLSTTIKGMSIKVSPNVTVTPNVNVPKIEVPEAHVTVDIPEIKVPQPIVNVSIPDINVPEIRMPEQMDVRGFISLMGYDKGLLSNPLPVQIRDAKGNPIDWSALGGGSMVMGGSSGGGFKFVTIDGIMASAFGDLLNPDGRIKVEMPSGSSGLTDAELRATAVPVSQVSGSNWSVSVSDIFGSTAANMLNGDNRLRVAVDTGSSGLTDAELRATAVPVSQVSGSNWSVEVTGVFGTTGSNVVNPDGRVKVELPSGSSGLTDTELRAAHLDVQQVSGSTDSVNIVSSITLETRQVSGAVHSVNVVGPIAQGDEATALRVVQAGNSVSSVSVVSQTTTLETRQVSGATDSVYVNNPVGAGEQATALRVVVAGDSDASVYVRNPVGEGEAATALRVVVAGDSIASVSVQNTVTIQGSLSSSAVLLTRQTNPTAVAADYVPFSADDMGRQLMRPIQVRDLIRTAYVSVSNGSETTLIAASAGEYLDLIYIMGTNNSDAAVAVNLRDVTGGNIQTTLNIPAFGQAGVSLPIPIPQSETGNNWTVDGPDETGRTFTISALFSREV